MAATQKEPPWWAGGMASVLATCVSHPFDLLKVRAQTSVGAGSSYGSVVRSIVRQDGILGLYAGLSASVLRQLTYGTTRFAVYDWLKKELKGRDRLNPVTSTIAAALAGSAGGVVGNPADLANVRMQNDGKLPPELRRNYKNALDAVYRIAKDEGFGGLFRGLSAHVARSAIVTVSQLVSYDYAKQLFVGSVGLRDGDVSTHIASSLVAGLVATTAANPVDVIKSRVMASKTPGEYGGVVSAFGRILRTEGPSAFFKGWLSAYIRMGPHLVLIFVFYEQIKKITTA
ncbi:mitochondrial carrier [Hyaloraphidium curvatum]|nr:mitochondrial carrier [Hyaloraphidium curvatum]